MIDILFGDFWDYTKHQNIIRVLTLSTEFVFIFDNFLVTAIKIWLCDILSCDLIKNL
jgi:hypothetical protein